MELLFVAQYHYLLQNKTENNENSSNWCKGFCWKESLLSIKKYKRNPLAELI